MQFVIFNPLIGRKDDSPFGRGQPVVHYNHHMYSDTWGRNNHQYFIEQANMNPWLPLGMLFIITALTFIIFVFRRWPGLVAGIIVGSLCVSLYMMLFTLKEEKPLYE